MKPVVSDFDTFTVGSKGMDYSPLPDDQASIMSWCLKHTFTIVGGVGGVCGMCGAGGVGGLCGVAGVGVWGCVVCVGVGV